jgi:hypothetical protein
VRPHKLECCTVAQTFGDALELSRVPNHEQRVKMVKVAPLGLWCFGVEGCDCECGVGVGHGDGGVDADGSGGPWEVMFVVVVVVVDTGGGDVC